MRTVLKQQLLDMVNTLHQAHKEIEIEQNRCAMACQGCGIAIFCFL